MDGDINTGITIRTVHLCDGVAAYSAGATLLYDSDPLSEHNECLMKATSANAECGEESDQNRVCTAGRKRARECGCCWWITRIVLFTRCRTMLGRRGLRSSLIAQVFPLELIK